MYSCDPVGGEEINNFMYQGRFEWMIYNVREYFYFK